MSYQGNNQDSSLQDRLLFVCGLHRSGTTLLARLLQDHPDISGFKNTGAPMDEGQHLQDLYPAASRFGGPGIFGFNYKSYLDEKSPLLNVNASGLLFNQWKRHWDLNCQYLLEKSPPNLIRTKFLHALFPKARFVVILRHPIAVAYATRKWSQTSIRSLINHWLVCHERFMQDRLYLPSCYIVKYEFLIENPAQVMNSLWMFLDLPPVQIERMIRTDVNELYISRWRSSLGNPFLTWRNRRTIALYENEVQKYGYSLLYPYLIQNP